MDSPPTLPYDTRCRNTRTRATDEGGMERAASGARAAAASFSAPAAVPFDKDRLLPSHEAARTAAGTELGTTLWTRISCLRCVYIYSTVTSFCSLLANACRICVSGALRIGFSILSVCNPLQLTVVLLPPLLVRCFSCGLYNKTVVFWFCTGWCFFKCWLVDSRFACQRLFALCWYGQP